MSTVYATEPAPSGRIVLETTHGPLDLELWCRECPTTTRWIMQLVLDGYFTSNIFHRILPNTLVQCGALIFNEDASAGNETQSTSAADWAEYRNHINVNASRAIERQRFELNSRLRFSHRGIAAMALSLDDNDDDDDARALLHSQFFFTLGEAPYLDGKHVIFGRLTGPTIFNAMRIGQNTAVTEEEEEDNVPVNYGEAPRIVQAKIMDNTIHTDLKPTPEKFVPWKNNLLLEATKDSKAAKKKKKRKGKYDVNVLSFGDELDGGADFVPKQKKHKRSKDSTTSTEAKTLVPTNDDDKRNEESKEENGHRAMTAQEAEQKFMQMAPSFLATHENSKEKETTPHDAPLPASTATTRASKQPAKTSKKKVNGANLLEAMRNKAQYSNASSRSRNSGDKKNVHRSEPGTTATFAKLMAFQSRMGGGESEVKASEKDQQQDNSLAARMARKAEREGATQSRNDGNPLAVTYTGQVLEADPRHAEEEYNRDWMSTRFQCRKHVDQFNSSKENEGEPVDEAADGRQMDEYKVIDDREQQQQQKGHKAVGPHHKDRDGDRHRRNHHRDRREHGGGSRGHHRHRDRR
mmetsp:Transcript_22339/g.62059  ORF Transcript_22339/g.62059 Transcript_22339/m.62059 type:complete len:579 (-) Transcript_22339:82-1818(-)